MTEDPPENSIEIVSSIVIETKIDPDVFQIQYERPLFYASPLRSYASYWSDNESFGEWIYSEQTRVERIRWWISDRLESLANWITQKVEWLRDQ